MIELPLKQHGVGTQIWIAAGVTDMRRGFQGLAAQVQTALDSSLTRAISSSFAAGARAEMSKNSGAASKEPVTQEGAPDFGAPEKMLKRRASSCVPESL